MNLFLNEDTYDGYMKYQKDLAKQNASGFETDEYGNVTSPKPSKKRAALDDVNPYLPDSSFLEAQETSKPNVITASSNPITLVGTLTKALLLIAVIIISLFGCIFISNSNQAIYDNSVKIFIFSALISTILAFAMGTNHSTAPALSFLYSVLFGTSIGFLAMFLEDSEYAYFGGILTYAIISAIGIETLWLIMRLTGSDLSMNSYLTFGIAGAISIASCYFFSGILSFAGINITPLHQTHFAAWLIIFLNILTVCISLQGETGVIKYAAEKRAPKYEEWFCAFGLSFTIIWNLFSTAMDLIKRGTEDE